MTKVDELYRCSLCGNVVRVVKAGFGKLVCCGEPMDLITEDELERGIRCNLTVRRVSGVKCSMSEQPRSGRPRSQVCYVQ